MTVKSLMLDFFTVLPIAIVQGVITGTLLSIATDSMAVALSVSLWGGVVTGIATYRRLR